MSTAVFLLTSIGFATAGQLLLRAGMQRVGEIADVTAADLLPLVGRVLSTWQVPTGLAFFGLSSVFWLVTLSRVELSVAYPVVSLGYVLILVFSYTVLGERPSSLTWVGATLVVVGIATIGLGQR